MVAGDCPSARGEQRGRGRSDPAPARASPEVCSSGRGLSRNGVKNYSKGPCVTILE